MQSEVQNLETDSAELSIGQILKVTRQDKKIEIAEVSSYLKIKANDIMMIENDNFNALTKHLYVPGLVHSYARFLKINPKTLEEKIKLLPIESNTLGKKLLNIGGDNRFSPNKDVCFNFLLIATLLFLILLSLYHSYEDKSTLMTNQDVLHELEKWRDE